MAGALVFMATAATVLAGVFNIDGKPAEVFSMDPETAQKYYQRSKDTINSIKRFIPKEFAMHIMPWTAASHTSKKASTPSFFDDPALAHERLDVKVRGMLQLRVVRAVADSGK